MEINLGADTAGLYTLETTTGEGESSKESGESDRDFDEKPGKSKDGKLGTKKKDKEDKDKKKDKDKGYAALGGESSPEESEMEVKSPFKGKKRSFKFSSRKEKKGKDEEKEKKKEKERKSSKECEASPKEVREESSNIKMEKPDKKKEKKEKDKEKEKEKEIKVKEKEIKLKEKDSKGKEIKNKLKIVKDKKKTKSNPSLEEDLPVFGVPLDLAVQRSRCHDGIDLPVVVRCCIDYIEEHGLQQEGIYRSSGLKTRVVELRRAYNNRENVELKDSDPPIIASLLKQFLRELPDNILTNELLSKFEDASAIKDPHAQEEAFCGLVRQLPAHNKTLLSWLMIHMDHVIEKERVNKMNVQNLSIVLCPTLNLTHRVLGCLFAYSRTLFAGMQIIRYVPPLSGVGVSLPDDLAGMATELKKQESLLAEIHGEMSVGSVAKHREEQLWEAQRIVTQLKRQLKLHNPSFSTSTTTAPVQPTTAERSPEVPESEGQDEELRLELALPSLPPAESPKEQVELEEKLPETTEAPQIEEPIQIEPIEESHQHITVIEVSGKPAEQECPKRKLEPSLNTDQELELILMIENLEREKVIDHLNQAIERERRSVERLQELLAETTSAWTDSSEEEEGVEMSEEEQEQLLAEVLRENRQLEEQNMLLQSQIEETRETCLKYRVQIRVREEKSKLTALATAGVIG